MTRPEHTAAGLDGPANGRAETVEREHQALLNTTLDPFRHAILELHAPTPGITQDYCAGCEPGDDATTPALFPCHTYTLARDWDDLLHTTCGLDGPAVKPVKTAAEWDAVFAALPVAEVTFPEWPYEDLDNQT